MYVVNLYCNYYYYYCYYYLIWAKSIVMDCCVGSICRCATPAMVSILLLARIEGVSWYLSDRNTTSVIPD